MTWEQVGVFFEWPFGGPAQGMEVRWFHVKHFHVIHWGTTWQVRNPKHVHARAGFGVIEEFNSKADAEAFMRQEQEEGWT